MQRFLICVLLGLTVNAPSWALFEDNDARRAILELREQMAAIEKRVEANESQKQINQETIKRLQDALYSSLTDSQSIAEEIARLRGRDEEVQNALIRLQSQFDLMRSTLEALTLTTDQLKVTAEKLQANLVEVLIDDESFFVNPQEKSLFESGLAAFRDRNYAETERLLQTLLIAFEQTPFRLQALYWLANAQYAQRNCQAAINSFSAGIALMPTHSRAPDLMMGKANCLIELKREKEAQAILKEIITRFPNDKTAAIAQERLSKLH